MPRPKKFPCVICGKRFKLKNQRLLHIFNNHLRPGREDELLRLCFCQGQFSMVGGWSFRGWQEHLRGSGGLQTHYAVHALNIGG